MTLLGQSAVVVWSDMADPASHDHWHSREHMPERIGIPGFLRARRCVTTDTAGSHYFVLYELRDSSVLTSAAYLERLNNPTAWTRAIMASARSLSRALCRVAASRGAGVGSCMFTLQLQPTERREAELQHWIVDAALPRVLDAQGVVAAHFLQREQSIERPDTVERRLRRRPDGFVEWVVLLEGYDETRMIQAAQNAFSAAVLTSHGAAEGVVAAAYRLAQVMVAAEQTR